MPAHALRAFASLVALFALSFLLACGNGNQKACTVSGGTCCTPSSSDACVAPLFLFATTQGGQLPSYPVDRGTGSLGTPVSTPGPAISLGLASRGNLFLYASDSQNDAVAAFSINGTSGALIPVPGSPFSLGGIVGEPTGLTMGPGNFFYAANINGSVNAFTVGGNGALSQTPNSPFAAGMTPVGIAFGQSPTSASFLYVTNSGDLLGTISGYSVNTTTGDLTPVPGSPTVTSLNSRPLGILFDGINDTVNGPYVYVALNQAGTIAGFSVDPNTGALTPVPGSPFPGVSLPIGLAQFQNFLLVGNSDQTISVFTITQATGALAPVSGSPFFTGTLGSSLAIAGQRLYAPQSGASGIVALNINTSTGALTPLTGSPFAAPSAPVLLSGGP